MKRFSWTTHNWLTQNINNRSLTRNEWLLRGIVLDLGCGDAPYKMEILERSQSYIGVDWPSSFHEKKWVDVTADLTKILPFGSGSVDTVTLLQVFEHIAEPQLLLCEVNRVLKPDGYLLMTIPFMWHVHEAPYDYFRYTRYGLEYMLRKSGFRIIEITENTGFWQTFILKFNYYTVKFARGIFLPLRPFWIFIWNINQIIAPLLDRIDWRPEETASYTVITQK